MRLDMDTLGNFEGVDAPRRLPLIPQGEELEALKT
jgi:hypothetical protein